MSLEHQMACATRETHRELLSCSDVAVYLLIQLVLTSDTLSFLSTAEVCVVPRSPPSFPPGVALRANNVSRHIT
ncbi:hypothetical protein SKAU_G00119570 [Synaphobranchus kaupii]|uniref:Uncharacterized protein n=1 Tax=Synaphobranchus kaupii TaxID=118154 RepID=A0A9Q1J1W9_SYNKA|nr:hypothetical protein SKAU_G00119570 [Synaphobranchus kaupii]